MGGKVFCILTKLALIAISSLLVGLIGCAKGASKTKLASNEIQLPESAQLVQTWMAGKSPNPIWTEFSGSYPTNWPSKLNLPKPTYLLKGTSLKEGPALNADAARRGVRMITFKGVAVNTPTGLITYFRSELNKAGCSITNDRALTFGNGGVHDITGSFPGGISVLLKVDLDKGLGKYAYFRGYISF